MIVGLFSISVMIYFVCFRGYSLLVVMFFVVNVCNNYAFDFNIAVPLHMIFRAVSLIFMILRFIGIKKINYFIEYYDLIQND